MSRKLFFIGLAGYGASFFLVAVQGFGEPQPGYLCAMMSLWTPLASLTVGSQGANGSGTLLVSLSLLPAGLANVVFPVAVFLRLTGLERTNAFQRLRVYVPLMAASSWLTFVLLLFVPREGHFLWLAGIVLALFPEEIAARLRLSRIPNPKLRQDSASSPSPESAARRCDQERP